MVYKEHLIELWVNGNKVELEDQKSINMRFNNVLFDPTKISSNQAEYSFEFEVPATPKNNAIFDYANNLSKLNKFHQRYNAEVYADGTVIFSGTITINGYKDKKYSLNLVSVKVYSLEDIFGDMTMNKIKKMDASGNIVPWSIPFNGAETINETNTQLDSEVVFPLVSYGVFQKYPVSKDEVGTEYTSKYNLDEYVNWQVKDFYPSHNMLATLKHCFESKGYTVGGDAFENQFLNQIYMSVNLADEQDPEYNVGNPRFGKVDLNVSWSTPMSTSGDVFTQDLKFPYFRVGGYVSDWNTIEWENERWNFEAIQIYDILNEGNITLNNTPNYMYQPNENIIVIPADGFYDIYLTVDARLRQSENINALQFVRDEIAWIKIERETEIPINPDFAKTMPLEIQLVKNYDDNIELIKGKNNLSLPNGYPWNPLYERNNWLTCFPHEPLGKYFGEEQWGWLQGLPPTKGGELASTRKGFQDKWSAIGMLYGNDEIMCYDQAVSPAFVCGFTTMGNDTGGGCAAVMKNGYSWSKSTSAKNEALYKQDGYFMGEWEYVGSTGGRTIYNKNNYLEAPSNYFHQVNDTMQGGLHCLVHFNKGDKLQLFAVQRDYHLEEGETVQYATSADIHLSIEARTPRSYGSITNTQNPYTWSTPIEFSDELNLANFFNREKKVSDWVKNIIDAYNLELFQYGNTVTINTKKKFGDSTFAAVDIDDRTNSDEAEAKAINYPKSMAVKYKTDTEEWGFEQSAEKNINSDGSVVDKDAILNDEDAWKAYGDSGYTIINLNDDSYATSSSDKSLQFSYTWYQDFNWYPTTSTHTRESDNAVTLKLPCISKYEYMIDGYDYEESMKHDGYGLSQRFWIKPNATNQWVWTRTYPPEQIWIYLPVNLYTNYRDVYFNLSYKDTENSILTNFFNINAYLASNYVEVDVYLSPDEYNRIKNGSLVHFDSDLYYPVEISGYDPSGYNPTTLKLMKKVN